MKVTETIERDCCQHQDLKPYKGTIGDSLKTNHPSFCQHCGQIWIRVRKMDAAGSMSPESERYVIGGS